MMAKALPMAGVAGHGRGNPSSWTCGGAGVASAFLTWPELLVFLCLGWPAKKMEPKPRLPLDAVWHRERYRGDEDLRLSIEAYDGILAAFYEERGMHADDSRWSKIMGERIGDLANRRELHRVLRDQGFSCLSGDA